MNNNDESIKMILALDEEFFEGWEWKEGDAFLYRPAQEDEWEIYHVGSFGTMVNNGVIVFATLIEDATQSQGEYRPLPNQEQLLKMCECDGDIYFESLALLHFANWLEDKVTKRHDFCLKHQAVKEMMLLWVMEKKYNKTWNGESWEK